LDRGFGGTGRDCAKNAQTKREKKEKEYKAVVARKQFAKERRGKRYDCASFFFGRERERERARAV
jgi:hypothetical protein